MKKQITPVRIFTYIIVLSLAAGCYSLISCSGGSNPVEPSNTATYVGTSTCAGCHQPYNAKFALSGHASIMSAVNGASAPTYPYSSIPSPPPGQTWANIAYAIGGYAWKAQFVSSNGFMLTGNQAQYNINSGAWSDYQAGQQAGYDCARCHTTGYSSSGNKDGLAGITGTWAFNGVQCEACHGPGSFHVDNPIADNINLDADAEDTCQRCHTRASNTTIEAAGGFLKNYQQYTEMNRSPHRIVFDCTTCHDTHASAVYSDPDINPDRGIHTDCTECHTAFDVRQKSATMRDSGVTCSDCHMPPMVYSAEGNIATFTADISTHLFRINTDISAAQFITDGSESNAYITVQYACQRCHIEGGGASVITLQQLGDYALNYHGDIDPDSYVTSSTCKMCHPDINELYEQTSHPYQLTRIESGVAPEYPFSSVPSPPPGFTWDQIRYVIGGYALKARFIGQDGYVITGNPFDSTQYNLETGTWVPFRPGEQVPYTDGALQTTDYSPSGHQDNLPGIEGKWTEAGVGCEACHGSGGSHLINPSVLTINVGITPAEQCSLCHIGDTQGIIGAEDGFIRNVEQADEIAQSGHSNLNCATCHDPHRSATYSDPVLNPNMGMRTDCNQCHPNQVINQKSGTMINAGVTCLECHMAPMVKSASGNLDIFTADMRTHLFNINTDVAADQFTADGTQSNPYITVAYACQRCHIEGGGASIISLDSLATYAADYHDPIDPGAYVGTNTCVNCHTGFDEPVLQTGHSNVVHEVSGGVAPEWPYSSVPDPPAGYQWLDISYVIGGYAWRANFLGLDGNLITGNPGDQTQYNVTNNSWSDYYSGDDLQYDCGRCHTTGYSVSGNQDDLPGILGTWSEDGVTCEGCHGPGGAHIQNPSPSTINVDMPVEERCLTCHTRGHIDYIEAWGGFGKNHAQAEELRQSPHNSFTCTDCHDGHRSSQYDDPVINPDKGLVISCETCHPNKASEQRSQGMIDAGLTCIDCHMAPMNKSGYADLSIFTADVNSHLFRINTDPAAPQFTSDGQRVNGYLTVQYACQRCHIDGGGATPLSLEGLAAYSVNYHSTVGPDEYVSSQMCSICHMETYQRHQRTGHSHVLNPVAGSQAPLYPYSTVPNPPVGLSWNDISYVIGGWAWKALFIGNDGNIITGNLGDTTQYNLATSEWVDYNGGQVQDYDCGVCHTTGYSPTGSQGGLPGIVGTWAEPGVQCEACHGAGGAHISNPSIVNINVGQAPGDTCVLCHSRGNPDIIEALDGFILNYNQYDEFMVSPHSDSLECVTCHDSHGSIRYEDLIYNPNQGQNMTCEQCHPEEAIYQKSTVMKIWGITCEQCHMPPLGYSAVRNDDTFTADVATHIFKIDTDIDAEQFSLDGTQANPYITIVYACQRCHIAGGGASIQTLGHLVNRATDYHED